MLGILLLILLLVLHTINWICVCVIPLRKKKIKSLVNSGEWIKCPSDKKCISECFHNSNVKTYFSNKSIVKATIAAMMIFVVMFLVLPVGGWEVAKNTSEFYMYQDGEQEYAVVFDNGEILVLEPVIIYDNIVIIDTREQLRIPSLNVSLKKVKYKIAIRSDDLLDH